MSATGYEWTDARLAQAKKLLIDGLSASQIAGEMGVGKGVIINVVRRRDELREIGFKRNAKNKAAAKANAEAEAKSKPRKLNGWQKAKSLEPRRVKSQPRYPRPEHILYVDLSCGAKSLVDVGEFECRWPVYGERVGMMCCARPISPGRTLRFCDAHMLRATRRA